jgi:hypothetical protein
MGNERVFKHLGTPIVIEQCLGLIVLAIVSYLGTLPCHVDAPIQGVLEEALNFQQTKYLAYVVIDIIRRAKK